MPEEEMGRWKMWMLLTNQLSPEYPTIKKSLDHKQYIIAKLLSWKRKRKETLGTLPLIPSSLMHPIRISPLETGTKPPPKTAFPHGNEQLDAKLYLWELTEETRFPNSCLIHILFIHPHTLQKHLLHSLCVTQKQKKQAPTCYCP